MAEAEPEDAEPEDAEPEGGTEEARTEEKQSWSGTLGYRQMQATREDLLFRAKTALKYASSHSVKTYHGRVAEGVFREWLESFLPMRYGVTSGYVVSQAAGGDDIAPHFDVIVYDRLNAPTLWVEINPDESARGYSRAIPAEHVLAVFEVKFRLKLSTAKEVRKKWGELKKLSGDVDEANERYKKFLPPRFFFACVFFVLDGPTHGSDQMTRTVLNQIASCFVDDPRIFGGIVLESESAPDLSSGEVKFTVSEDPIGGTPGFSDAQGPGSNVFSYLMWGRNTFTRFAFDVLALLGGTYRPGYMSSLHALEPPPET